MKAFSPTRAAFHLFRILQNGQNRNTKKQNKKTPTIKYKKNSVMFKIGSLGRNFHLNDPCKCGLKFTFHLLAFFGLCLDEKEEKRTETERRERECEKLGTIEIMAG